MRRACLILISGLAFLCMEAAGEPLLRKIPSSELQKYWETDQVLAPRYVPQAIMAQLEGCYVAEYTIDASGVVRDSRVTFSDVSIGKRNWPGMKRRDVAKFRRATFAAQEQAVLEAVNELTYVPAAENAAKFPVLTRTLPIVVTVLSIERPDDPEAVASERAAMEARRDESLHKCSNAGVP